MLQNLSVNIGKEYTSSVSHCRAAARADVRGGLERTTTRGMEGGGRDGAAGLIGGWGVDAEGQLTTIRARLELETVLSIES